MQMDMLYNCGGGGESLSTYISSCHRRVECQSDGLVEEGGDVLLAVAMGGT